MSFLKYVLLSAAFLSSGNALAQNNDQKPCKNPYENGNQLKYQSKMTLPL
jgi:hypothetical protein